MRAYDVRQRLHELNHFGIANFNVEQRLSCQRVSIWRSVLMQELPLPVIAQYGL